MATTEDTRTRESVPFRVRTADGDSIELTYSSPRSAATHDEQAVLESLPWFEPGKPLRNYMLHETDFVDEVEQIWGRPWGAEGIGTLREVLVSRPTENEIRPEYAREWQYYYSSAAGNADLGKLQAQFDEYYAVLEEHGVRVNYIEPPVPAIGAYGWMKNLVTLAGGGLVVRGGAILHRYGLGSWQRGREVIWEQVLAALQVPIYLTIHGKGICEPGAGRWLDSKTFAFNESVVANEEGLRQIEFVLSNLGIELVKRDFTIIEVPVEEYWDLALNGVTLAPGKVVMNAGSPTVVRALEKHDVEVVQVDFSESHTFAIAGLHCATLELVRDQSGTE